MTAMSAPRASETPSTANPLRDLVASLRTVQVPGSPATYANRAYLRDLGLRWDPANHRWHGTTTAERVKELRERLHLEVWVFGDLEAPPNGPATPKPAPPVHIAVTARDYSRTRVEGRLPRARTVAMAATAAATRNRSLGPKAAYTTPNIKGPRMRPRSSNEPNTPTAVP